MSRRLAAVAVLVAAGFAAAGCASAPARRPFHPYEGERFVGHGISYGPHRAGQRPGGPGPSRAQLLEDLALLAPRWDLLRVYASDGPTPELLALVRERGLPLKVLLGAWIAPETAPGAREANRAQVEGAVRLANAYPELVLAVVVGNETQVTWSAHRCDPATLVHWLREARRGTAKPVGTADDFGFWLSKEADVIAREVDLLVVHAYAMWNGEPLERALAFTQEKWAAVRARHPGLPAVLGEAGWATRRHTEGDQAKYIKGVAGEAEQARFFAEFEAWVRRERIASTWFEAFDEPWKGGPHPDEVEKHWGLWREDRTPKPAVQGPPPAR